MGASSRSGTREAWPGFSRVLEGTLQIEQISIGNELEPLYRDLVEGRVDPGYRSRCARGSVTDPGIPPGRS